VDEKPCSLIAVVPPHLVAPWAENFEALIRRHRPAALVLKAPTVEPSMLAAAANRTEIAILGTDGYENARLLGLTGVLLDDIDPASVEKSRDALGSSAIIGAAVEPTRHSVMEIAEAGADFLVFSLSEESEADALAELCTWWDEVAQTPFALHAPREFLSSDTISAFRPDFLLIEERDNAGESLTFATELGLQSES
jgi:thiamine-phosphate pyrophosphorylase